jgi:hypothetical protein
MLGTEELIVATGITVTTDVATLEHCVAVFVAVSVYVVAPAAAFFT